MFRAIIFVVFVAISACAVEEARDEGQVSEGAIEVGAYLGIETRLLSDDLVSFLVRIEKPATPKAVDQYAACAAAQYALIRGFGFARHVRTAMSDNDDILAGDAIYVISAALPRGSKTLDAEVTMAACAESGVPSV